MERARIRRLGQKCLIFLIALHVFSCKEDAKELPPQELSEIKPKDFF